MTTYSRRQLHEVIPKLHALCGRNGVVKALSIEPVNLSHAPRHTMACSQHSADDARRSGRALMAADDDEQSVAAQSAQLGALWWWKLHSDRISVHLQAAPRYHLPATVRPAPSTVRRHGPAADPNCPNSTPYR